MLSFQLLKGIKALRVANGLQYRFLMNLNQFNQESQDTLEYLSEKFESILDDNDESDVSLNNGVLTVIVDKDNTFLLNKQTPNRQIWLSSPISGPIRFDFCDGCWQDKHSDEELKDLLSKEFTKLLNKKIQI